ncbi:hypothetical protein ABMB67_003245 [Halalkalibacter oceani]
MLFRERNHLLGDFLRGTNRRSPRSCLVKDIFLKMIEVSKPDTDRYQDKVCRGFILQTKVVPRVNSLRPLDGGGFCIGRPQCYYREATYKNE